MIEHLTPRAVNRARWFAELTAALDEGERILDQLVRANISPAESDRLRRRLIELRAELGKLNRVSLTEGRIVGPVWPNSNSNLAGPSRELHPDWRPQRG